MADDGRRAHLSRYVAQPKSRREEPRDADLPEPSANLAKGASPEDETLLADSVGLALLVLLETLAPAERLAFVLHDMFDRPFDEIAPIVGCSPAAARQLASRARRRVQGASADPDADADSTRQREVVDAFLLASRSGDLTALLAVLDKDVVLRPDRAALEASATPQRAGGPKLAPEVRGAASVADSFSGRARGARPALIDGSVGMVWAPGGKVRVAFPMVIADGKILAIDVIGDPEHLGRLDVVIFDKG